jgi:basic amino acid/polyamine antiporter, APA family
LPAFGQNRRSKCFKRLFAHIFLVIMTKNVKGLFTRPASGLVREVGMSQATFYSLACTLGTLPALTIAYVVSYPQVLWGGIPLFSWTLTLAAIPSACFMLCLSILTQAMPRSGGDYVYTSRATIPYLGFIEGWMLILAIGAVFGFNGWAATFGLGMWFKTGMVAFPSWLAIGNTLDSTIWLIISGVVMFVLLGALALTPARRYHLIFSALSALALVSIVIQLAGLAGASTTGFASNFGKVTGVTQQSVLDEARGMGWDPNWFDSGGMVALLGYTLFAYTGASFSTYMAGELKGNIQKNVIVAMLTTVGVVLFTAYYMLPFSNIAGYQFSNAWAFLFWNAPDKAPLGAPPSTTLIAAIASPGLIGIILFAGFFLLVVLNFTALSGFAYAGVRVIFAQSMDRLYPMKFASVNQRTHQPVIATIIVMVVGFMFYIADIVGYSPFEGLWYLAATAVIGYLFFPAINCILLKRRRPDIFELAPTWSKRKFLGAPVMVWLGIIWLAYLVPIFALANLWVPIHQMFGMESSVLLNYAFSTGLILVGAGLFLGTIYYIVRRVYISRQGIDLNMIFSAIPPE